MKLMRLKNFWITGLTLSLVLNLFVFFVDATVWYKPNQSTMAWDAVTTRVDGSPIPATSLVVYNAYLKYGSGAPEMQNVPDQMFEATEYTFTFKPGFEGAVIGCVEAVRVNKAKWQESPRVVEVEDRSEIVCSDMADYAQGEVWGWSLWIAPKNPEGLRPK